MRRAATGRRRSAATRPTTATPTAARAASMSNSPSAGASSRTATAVAENDIRAPAIHRTTAARSGRGFTGGLRPAHRRRHRGQDRRDVAAGLQPEDGAAVIEQVELDVAPAPHLLLVPVGLSPGRGEVAPY